MKIKRGTGTRKAFEIASVCKDDILSIEKQDKEGNIIPAFKKSNVKRLTESDMKKIASKLADDYCDQLFWNSLEIIAEQIINNKKKKKKENKPMKELTEDEFYDIIELEPNNI